MFPVQPEHRLIADLSCFFCFVSVGRKLGREVGGSCKRWGPFLLGGLIAVPWRHAGLRQTNLAVAREQHRDWAGFLEVGENNHTDHRDWYAKDRAHDAPQGYPR